MKRIIYAGLFLFVLACSSGVYQPSVTDLANASYGPKPSKAALPGMLHRYYNSSDRYDPAGVRIEECKEAEKAWWPKQRGEFEVPNEFVYGWKASCSFNAKGHSDEYLGEVWEDYYIKNNRIVRGYIPPAYNPLFK